MGAGHPCGERIVYVRTHRTHARTLTPKQNKKDLGVWYGENFLVCRCRNCGGGCGGCDAHLI